MYKKGVLTNIQQVRAIAAILVMVAHVLNSVTKRVTGVDEFLIDGGIGVDIFFVISGFIMIGVTHDKFGSLESTREFLIRRVARIIPIYWILTLVMACLLLATSHPVNLYDLTTSLAFYPVVNSEGKVRPILGQGWTLELEMMFYVIFSGCLVFGKRTGTAILCTSLLVLPIIGTMELDYPLRFWSSEIIIEFLFGIVLGLLYRAFGPMGITKPLIPISLLVIVMILTYQSVLSGWGRPLAWLLASGVVGLACFSQQAKGANFASRSLIKLGDWSYSLYLVHIIVMAIFMGISDRVFGRPIGVMVGIGLFVSINMFCILCAYLCYTLLERPLESKFIAFFRGLHLFK